MNDWVTPQEISERLSYDHTTKRWALDLGCLFAAIPSLRCRRVEARGKVERIWGRVSSDGTWQGDKLIMPSLANGFYDTTELPVAESVSLLDAIASRPLSAKELCGVLEISKQERLRWTKDGRLKQSGTLTFKAAQQATVPTYSARWVNEFLRNGRKVDHWRKTDANEANGSIT
ncbi:MAG: hypothetical protein HRT64_11590 [Erythrobacter sp.]|nr:hypothetical protein [Erythrobacter sp.]